MALGDRLQRLSPVLAGMARDLAAARREVAALRSENARLHAHVGESGNESPGAVLCERCGVAAAEGLVGGGWGGAR